MSSSSGGAPVKVASHDRQLATLISMGFEATAAEQALERNDWSVSESIDYLLAAGIGMNDRTAPPVMEDDDDEKSVERQRFANAASTMIPTNIASNSTRRPLPTLVEDRSRGHGIQDELVDGWIDEPNTNAAPNTRGRSVRRGDGSVGPTDVTHPRRSNNASRSRQERGRGSTTGHRHAHFEDDPLEQPRYSRNSNRQTPAQDTNEHHEPPRYTIPPEPRHLPVTYNVRDFKPPDTSYEDRLGDGFSAAGVPTMATEGRHHKKKRHAENADYGVHLATVQESFPGRDGGEDDISMVAMAGGSRKQSAVSSLTGMPSLPEARSEDAAVSRKDIRRLYILVCAALVIVVVAVVITLSLVFTIGKSPAAADSNNTLIPPKPTPSGPLPMPSPTPVDAVTTTAPLDGSNETNVTEAPNVTEPTEPSDVFESSATEPSDVFESSAPIFALFPPTEPPSAPPGENRRVEHQQREEESHRHLRSDGQSDGQRSNVP